MRPLILRTRCRRTDPRKTVSKHVWRAAEKLRAKGLVVGHLKALIKTVWGPLHYTARRSDLPVAWAEDWNVADEEIVRGRWEGAPGSREYPNHLAGLRVPSQRFGNR